ncbi:MAG: PfkB family carbohydrate kinase [Gammaproteobacteria bacterium]|nr:PfkB family carbohydrate kinase [Gammaproteobacteria bacterium]MDH4315232.1 PfkB family carbohydrate kinase [Gammaproteobacteria bacterium]MDH5215012.1 PfkB family carbohydrate kinase [Gammaproteobacteria bacterium]MDH5501460.1 PfkB family carbohydrate kinase [Gammaproteobacteria bacterium]
MKVVCVGDCGIDHYLPSGRLLGGGITANFARHAANEFAPNDEVHVVSAIGDEPDAAGIVRRTLKHERIRCHIVKIAGATPVQFIRIAADGEKEFVRYDEGVLANFRIDEESATVLRSADLLVTTMFEQVRGLFASVMSVPAGGQVAVDFADFAQHPDFAHLESFLDRIDIAFFGLSSNDRKLIDQLSKIAERWHKLFVVTLGANGSRAFFGHDVFRQKAIPVNKVVDTTGAGDAFAAAFLASFVKSGDVAASLQRGAVLSASVIGHIGASPD